jgi:hypothetical protein
VKNPWIKKSKLVLMPTTFDEDRIVEFEFVRRDQVEALCDFWRMVCAGGHISREELRILLGVIGYNASHDVPMNFDDIAP